MMITTSARELLQKAAAACRILEMEGHGDMTLGHLSVRDPDGAGFWMKRNAIGLGEVLGEDDFVLLDWDGHKLKGGGQQHSEWPIHSEIYKMRSDVNAVVHSHPFHACVFSASTEALQPYTLDADYFIDVPRHVDDLALVIDKAQGRALSATMGQHFAVLMGNHGVTFCGTSLEHCICVGVFLEKACRAQVVGKSSNLSISVPNAEARDVRHNQIMTPRHWDHSWNYFCRKLAVMEEMNSTKFLFG